MTITLTYDNTNAKVSIACNGIVTGTGAKIERSTDQTRWTTVRNGLAATVTGSAISTLDDYEFVPGVANYYRVSATTVSVGLLDGTFETGVTGWATSFGSTVQSGAQFHSGSKSAQMTTLGGAPTQSTLRPGNSNLSPIVAGVSYTLSMWAYSVAGYATGYHASIDWYDASKAYISTSSSGNTAIPAATWTQRTVTAAAPANAVYAAYGPTLPTPPDNTVLFFDDITITGPSITGNITPNLTQFWLKSVTRPFLNQVVSVINPGDAGRPTRGIVNPVVGRTLGIAVSDVRGGQQFTLELRTNTANDAQEIDYLLASGDILFFHVPAAYDYPSRYILASDASAARPFPTNVGRNWSIQCEQVAAPGPDVVYAIGTWQTVLNKYPSWAALLAANPTWADVLQLVGDPSEVIVG